MEHANKYNKKYTLTHTHKHTHTHTHTYTHIHTYTHTHTHIHHTHTHTHTHTTHTHHTHTHTHTHSRCASSQQVTNWPHKLLLTQHNKQKDNMQALGWIRTNIPEIYRLQVYALDHMTTGNGEFWFRSGKGDNVVTLCRQSFKFS